MTVRLPQTLEINLDGSIEVFERDEHTNLYNGKDCPFQLHNVKPHHITDGKMDLNHLAIFRTGPDDVKRTIPNFVVHDDGVHKYPLSLKSANTERHGILEIIYQGPFHSIKVEWQKEADVLLYFDVENLIPKTFPYTLTTCHVVGGMVVERNYTMKYEEGNKAVYVFDGNLQIDVEIIDKKLVIT